MSENGKIYLKKKFPTKSIINTAIPYGEPNDLVKNIGNIEEDEVTIINLPTPKQEEIARVSCL